MFIQEKYLVPLTVNPSTEAKPVRVAVLQVTVVVRASKLVMLQVNTASLFSCTGFSEGVRTERKYIVHV